MRHRGVQGCADGRRRAVMGWAVVPGPWDEERRKEQGRRDPEKVWGGGRGEPARCRESDRGSATVWSLGAITVLLAVFGGVLALGHAVVVRHRAAGGADLAALAAADHWAEGGAAACARAERVTAAQGVRLVRCVILGETSDVSVASGSGPFTAEVRARAGPAGPVEPAAPESPDVPDEPQGVSSADANGHQTEPSAAPVPVPVAVPGGAEIEPSALPGGAEVESSAVPGGAEVESSAVPGGRA